MDLMNLYNHMPIWMQNMAFSAAGARIQTRRYGAGFRSMLTEFESHEGWSRERLFAWRDERLRELVVHAYATVPYYRLIMDEGGIDPSSIRTGDDLKALPLLTKAMIKKHPEMFVSSKVGSMHIEHAHTSGTTGSSFQFDTTIECRQAQFACFWRYYHAHGLTSNTWQAQFSSRVVVPRSQNTPPFWRVDYPGRRYYMSAFHESPANLAYYYRLICNKRFEWISGYPSLMSLLAQWMNERELNFDFVRKVTCGAENLLEHQADAMTRAFGVRPIQTYGQTENVAIISEQPDGRLLVDEDFSVVEFLPQEGADGSTEGSKSSEIVGTSLFNYATPLIRYRTGDIAICVDGAGARREIISLDGRSEDYLSLPDGTQVGKLDHVFKDTPHFQEAQIYQKEDYSVVLRVVGEPYLCVEDERIALASFRESVGPELPVSFEYTTALPRTNSAKMRYVVSDVAHDDSQT